jgi:threonine/homoserine/homoserine lactone efflux protein
MTGTLFFGLFAFSIAAAFTPGPNNLIALSTGANYGYRRTLPHVFGVCLGFALMMIIVGLGLGSLLLAFPPAFMVLKYLSLCYLLYLAFRIASSKGIGEKKEGGKPITFIASAAFQWINPKAWIASITLVTSFTNPEAYWSSLAVGAAMNMILAFSAVSVWALFGTIVKTWLSNPVRLGFFNWTMAGLLVLSVAPSVLLH